MTVKKCRKYETQPSFPGFTEPYDPNEEIEEENEENNENDKDQYSGLSCWACDAPNFEECAKIGKEMKCKSNQVTYAKEKCRPCGNIVFQFKVRISLF